MSRNWILQERVFFRKKSFELNLIPTQTVTRQYISLLVTRRHFFKKGGRVLAVLWAHLSPPFFKRKTDEFISQTTYFQLKIKGHRIVKTKHRF